MAAHSSDSASNSPPEPGRLRAAAAEVLARVLGGASLDAALPAAQQLLVSAPDRTLLQALCYGVLRDLRLLEWLTSRLLERPATDQRLQALLLAGLYQLRSMRVPAHAAVSETVAATMQIGQPRARGLVNAVLRRYLREREALEQSLPEDPAIRYSHPDWLVRRLQADWPESWQAIVTANQVPGPMSLRINRRRITREAWLEKLQQAGQAAHLLAHACDGLTLAQAVPVQQLPGFADGEVSVQDGAAQLAVEFLALEEVSSRPLRVLDACAAPGGKSAHILERAEVELLALDHDAGRLRRVEETLARLGLSAHCQVADAADTAAWWDGQAFDRILLDAPCSGSGVIRRHPDIKWLRRDSDIVAMADRQQRLLTALWPLLAPGGLLVYASCSVLRAEGEDVIETFLQRQTDAAPLPIKADWGESCGVGHRIASGSEGMDGFYYARLRKRG